MLMNRDLGGRSAEGRVTAIAACQTCGTELRLSAKFCDECGAPITATTRPAE